MAALGFQFSHNNNDRVEIPVRSADKGANTGQSGKNRSIVIRSMTVSAFVVGLFVVKALNYWRI